MIPYGKQLIDDDDIQAVVDVLRSSHLTQGPAVENFEKSVCEYTGAKFAVAVSNGTAALHLAYLAVGVGKESTVLTSPITFVATANASLYCGGKVDFVDIDPTTLNMSTEKACLRMDKGGVDVLAPVHFAGAPCDMETLSISAKKNGCLIIEDAAHAMGGQYKSGDKVGSCAYSDVTIFSFHPVKAIAAGEGGVITTNSEEIYRALLRLRSHGINKLNDQLIHGGRAFTEGLPNLWYYEMHDLGFNYRLTDIQSALANSQLKKLDFFVERRKYLAYRYDEALTKLKGISPYQTGVRELSGHHLYTVKISFDCLGITRADFMSRLKRYEILTQVHYIPVPMQPFYEKLGFEVSDYPHALEYYSNCLSIPLYPSLSDDKQNYVIEKIGEIFYE